MFLDFAFIKLPFSMITCKLHLEKCLRTEMPNAAMAARRHCHRHLSLPAPFCNATVKRRLVSPSAPISASAPRVEGLTKCPASRYHQIYTYHTIISICKYIWRIYLEVYVVYTTVSLQVNYVCRNLVAVAAAEAAASAAEKGFSF